MTRVVATGLMAMALTAGCASPVRMTVAPGPHAGCRGAGAGTPPPPLVAWIQPDDDGERRALDERCAQVGRPLLPTTASIEAPVAQRVLVATWNMHDGRGDVLALVDALRRGTPESPAPDAVVVLLQEVVRALGPPTDGSTVVEAAQTGVRDVPSIVSRLGWHLAYVPGRRNRLRPDGAAAADRGVAILSSLPITDIEAIELPIERQRRVVISGVVRGTAHGRPWQLRVVSAHLENRSGARRLWARAGASRTRQTEALLEALALSPSDSPAETLPLVVGGDFNLWLGTREASLRLLRERLGTFDVEDARPTMDNAWRLDYLFPRLPSGVHATHRRLDSMFGSDHYPVVASLDFGRRDTGGRLTDPFDGVTTCKHCH